MVRSSIFLSSIFFLLSVPAALAGKLHIKVVDSHSAAVAGAQVFIYRAEDSAAAQVRTSSGEGVVTFNVESSRPLRVEVLAPGFAVTRADVPSAVSSLNIELKVASPSETVIVTATRTLLPEQDTASSTSLLTADEINTMRPGSFGEALRFLPGAVVNVAGQRGGLGSLFVRGGDSRYNKVLVDGVPINEPGGTFDFGTIPLEQVDRVEFQRGTQSTLYGSDAMTSVLQVFTRNGTTAVPELRIGADGGNFTTAHGYVSLAGARSRFDYNAFADQFQTNGQGPNADYSNALQGGNVGVQISPAVLFRLRSRHSNRRTGVPGEWDFNGQRLLAPDTNQSARSNNFLASGELLLSLSAQWQHRLIGYEYNTRRLNQDVDTLETTRGCDSANNVFFDCPFLTTAHINRAGVIYQGDYTPRSWARTTVGYEFEDENGRFFTHSVTLNSDGPEFDFMQTIKGLRLNHAAYVQQQVTWKRLTAIAGVRYAHNETFGDKAIPRVALSLMALRGRNFFSGTRLRFSYATGIKEPRFEESFPNDAFTKPNFNLKPEQNRAFEAGIQQSLMAGRFSVDAVYYNNLFRDQIDFSCCDEDFRGQYVNINQSMSHGAEFQLRGRITSRMSLNGGYLYTSSQILEQPFAFDPLHQPGQPLLRRPKHSGNLLITYLGSRWGADLGGTFIGRRSDSDFMGFGITHAPGYGRVDFGGWYALNSRVTAYANLQNALNNHYNEVVGYPALSASFTAGMRFRIGGE